MLNHAGASPASTSRGGELYVVKGELKSKTDIGESGKSVIYYCRADDRDHAYNRLCHSIQLTWGQYDHVDLNSISRFEEQEKSQTIPAQMKSSEMDEYWSWS
jgi:hypothetical protein